MQVCLPLSDWDRSCHGTASVFLFPSLYVLPMPWRSCSCFGIVDVSCYTMILETEPIESCVLASKCFANKPHPRWTVGIFNTCANNFMCVLLHTHFVREMGQNNNILPLVVHKLKEKQVRFGRSACVSDCVTSRARSSLSVSSLSSPHCTVGPSMFGMGCLSVVMILAWICFRTELYWNEGFPF